MNDNAGLPRSALSNCLDKVASRRLQSTIRSASTRLPRNSSIWADQSTARRTCASVSTGAAINDSLSTHKSFEILILVHRVSIECVQESSAYVSRCVIEKPLKDV